MKNYSKISGLEMADINQCQQKSIINGYSPEQMIESSKNKMTGT
jgi:hypothetical protein